MVHHFPIPHRQRLQSELRKYSCFLSSLTWLLTFSQKRVLIVRWFLLSQLLIGMHSVNAVFLLGEAALNSLVSTLSDYLTTWSLKDTTSLNCSSRSFTDQLSNLCGLTELPLVPDRILLPLYGALRHFSMDCSCSNSDLVNIVASNS